MNDIKNFMLKSLINIMVKNSLYERKLKGLNQLEYAEKIKISPSSVKKIELGKCYDLKLIDKYINQ